MPKFLNYLRYRSWGLISLIIYLIYQTQDLGLAIILILFLIHTYYIYKKEDGGVNHLIIIEKINNLEAHQDKNQLQLIDLMTEIYKKI